MFDIDGTNSLRKWSYLFTFRCRVPGLWRRRHILRSVDSVSAFLEADAEPGLGSDGIVLEVIDGSIEDEIRAEVPDSSAYSAGSLLVLMEVFEEARLNGFGGLADVEGHWRAFGMPGGWRKFDDVERVFGEFSVFVSVNGVSLPDQFLGGLPSLLLRSRLASKDSRRHEVETRDRICGLHPWGKSFGGDFFGEGPV